MKKSIFILLPISTFAALAFNLVPEAPAAEGGLELPARVVDSAGFDAMLDPDSGNWDDINPAPIHLNRTPPMYAGDALDDGYRPEAFVKIARSGDSILVHLEWTDNTVNSVGGGKLQTDAGEEHVYVKHSEHTDAFADAACVMLPRERGEMSTYPSMIMGQDDIPVDLVFWRAGEGFSFLQAHGRATVEKTGSEPPQGNAGRDTEGWKVVMRIGDVPPGTPLCFAIWDGGRTQRDGLKFYSLWYEVR